MPTTKLSIGSAELSQADILGPWYQPGMWLSVLEDTLKPDHCSEYKLGCGKHIPEFFSFHADFTEHHRNADTQT